MRYMRVLLGIAAAMSACAAYAADTANEVYIYRGGALTQEGITAGSWGSGKALEVSTKALVGSKSIKITTQSLYAGGRIDFAQPVKLYTGEPEKNRYIVFSFWFDETQRVDPAAGTGNDVEVEPYFTPKATKIRFIFSDAKGKMTSIEQPSGQLDIDDNWVRIAVPLSKLKASEGADSYQLSRVLIFTDLPSTLYIGEIKLMTDITPISAEASSVSQMFPANTKAYFWAITRGGLSQLSYTWDFDSANGVQSEATGMVANHIYTTGGDYKVTLTVSDINGIKAPVTITRDVSIND